MAGLATLTPDDLARVPKAVLDQYHQANALVSQGNSGADPEPADPLDTELPDGDPVIPFDDSAAPPLVPAPAATDPLPSSNVNADERIALLEQQYRTLKGMFNAEVPKLQAAIKDREQVIEQLQSELHQAKTALVLAPNEPLTEEHLRKVGLTDDELDNGLDVFTGVQKMIDAQVNARVAAAMKEALAPYDAQRWNTYEQARAARIPNWKALNRDPRWLSFLATRDPITKSTYQDLAQAANDSLDLDALCGVFEQFKARYNITTSNVPLKPEIRGGANGVPTKPTMTMAEWTKRMGDLALGKVKGNRATREQLAAEERELESARLEKRIR